MRSIIIFLAATVLALWNSPPVRAEERDAARGAVDALIERQMERLAIPGVSLALIQDGHIVDVRTYGYADREAERPVAQDTLFETASLSKAAFSYFVLRQVDRGV
ncbi:MAG: serine hydrolase domain-containing protein, partial [Pseudomonadota bacterium]